MRFCKCFFWSLDPQRLSCFPPLPSPSAATHIPCPYSSSPSQDLPSLPGSPSPTFFCHICLFPWLRNTINFQVKCVLGATETVHLSGTENGPTFGMKRTASLQLCNRFLVAPYQKTAQLSGTENGPTSEYGKRPNFCSVV